MPLTPGTRVGPYEIVSPIGAGGMGEVYRARDTRLGRDVAIKTLPEALTGDSERVARLQREAQLLAALSHPNIATIFGLETVAGTHFLVLELVDGESLAEVVARRRLPLDQSLTIARQIVDALEAAHDKGIIHRDLKPANIMLTQGEQVKVLDFGLARALEGDANSSVTNSPTLSFAATQAGVILGTAAYMSPEQAKGRAADKRSDVWAFGCVLFEMLTGQRAFDGEDVSDILAGILRGEPDWSAFPSEVPEWMRTLIRRCVEKDRRARIPDMSVVRFLMTEATAAAAAPPRAKRARVPRGKIAAIAVGGAVAGAALLGAAQYVGRILNPPPPRPQMRFAIAPATADPLIVVGTDRTIAISPDGKYVVYAAGVPGQAQLVVRPIGELQGTRLAGTEGGRQPFFSPDSRWIAFFSGPELKKIAVSGGPTMTLCRIGESPPRGGAWGEGDTIVFATASPTDGLMRIGAAGGEPKPVSKPAPERGERDHILPSMLPGGRVALFTILAPTGGSQIAAIDLDRGEVTPLVSAGSHAEFIEPEYLVFAASGSLRAVRFDAGRLKTSTDPVPVLEGVMTAPTTGAGYFSPTRTGALLFVPGTLAQSSNRLVWIDRKGKEETLPAPPRSYSNPRLSPDDTRLALDVRDQNHDIWIWHFARQTLERLTVDASTDQNPIWTKDGRRIVFGSGRAGGIANLHAQAADGTGAVERWGTSPNVQVPYWISRDGLAVLFMEVAAATGPDLMLLRRDGAPRTEPILRTTFSETNPDISPDGRWIAYQSNEGGAPQIFVRPFPKIDEGRWQISVAGGTRPVWGRDGKELFFLDLARSLLAVPVRTTPSFSADQPVKLFDSEAFVGLPGRPFDPSVDSQRFLFVKEVGAGDRSAAPPSMVLLLNWVDELEARLPPPQKR